MPEDVQEPEAAADTVEGVAAKVADDLPDATAQQIADLREQVARARADYANLQARTQREAALERDRVKARVLEGFLQVYEYGRLAAAEADRAPGPLADGVKMVVREFDRLLELEGVRPIGAMGEPFDNSIHEALGEEAVEGIAPGHVSKVIAHGYRLGERILRYARVTVAPSVGRDDDGEE